MIELFGHMERLVRRLPEEKSDLNELDELARAKKGLTCCTGQRQAAIFEKNLW